MRPIWEPFVRDTLCDPHRLTLQVSSLTSEKAGSLSDHRQVRFTSQPSFLYGSLVRAWP